MRRFPSRDGAVARARRLFRRRAWAALVLVVGVVVVGTGWLLVSAGAASAAPGQPTIAFLGGGPAAHPAARPPEPAAVEARPPETRPDGRGERLLAVVATICVFGVTSAIIRAIVAQRTTRALGPR